MELVELPDARKDRVQVNKKTIQSMLQQVQLAVQQITSGCDDDDGSDDVDLDIPEESMDSSAPTTDDTNNAEYYDRLKSRVDCADFLKTLEKIRATPSQVMSEEGCSWDIISKSDTWEGENAKSETEDYVLVRQEDIVEGIASFMAAYLLSLEQTKDLTPNQLQEVLSKTFSTKKRKGKLRKAWDGSKVIYNVASWGATAIGIYQNPALCTAASAAFWTSFRVISKLF